MRALILEDNCDRRVAMIRRLAERFPFLHVAFFDASDRIIDFMKSDKLEDVVIISLDHDLEPLPGPQGDWVDPGTGLDVARWLSKRPQPLCPVIVHTTNSRAGSKMMRLLEKSQWTSHRVIPHDDLGWIDTDWFRVVRNSIVDFAPQRPSTPVLAMESKVAVFRSLLSGTHNSGQAFCREAMRKLTDAYVLDLRQMLGDVSAEIFSFVSMNALAPALDLEGPIARWFREIGVNPENFQEIAQQGPQAVQSLPVDESSVDRLLKFGVRQLQVEIIEIADMQALLIVSSARPLALAPVQAIISELKQAIEIAVFIGVRWTPGRQEAQPVPQ